MKADAGRHIRSYMTCATNKLEQQRPVESLILFGVPRKGIYDNLKSSTSREMNKLVQNYNFKMQRITNNYS